MLVHWIWLATLPGINDRMKRILMEHFQDPEDLYFAEAGAYTQVEGLSPEGRQRLSDKDLTQAEEILRACMDKEIRLLTYRDAAYPRRLQNITDPPMVLYYKGKLPDFDGLPLIGVVGTRQASPYGLTISKRIGAEIAACGGVVVSGMAYGIDGMSMRGALSAGGMVVGVLGCGADVVYPASNRSLFADTEAKGCLLTEFPPGTPPSKWNFPKRNRIISGLCCGVLVVEAPEKSGALITAQQAADQGRDVFAIPGNVDVATCAGSNRLIRDGAIMVSCGWDVMSEYEALFPGKIKRATAPSHQSVYPDEVEKAAPKDRVAQKIRTPSRKKGASEKKISVDNGGEAPYSDVKNKLESLTPEEQTVVRAISQGERLVDDIIAESGLTAGMVLAALTLLEVKGAVERLPGKRVQLRDGCGLPPEEGK